MKKILFALALITAMAGQAQIMKVSSVEPLNVNQDKNQVVQAVAISPQGDYLLLSTDTKQGLVKWDLASGTASTVTTDPGAGSDVRITGDDVPGAVTIQEKAVCHDLSDTYVWVLDANGRPRKQLIETGKTFDSGMCLVTSGLTGDETYITDGILQVRSGCLIQEADDAGDAAGTAAPDGTAPAAEPQAAAPQQESAN